MKTAVAESDEEKNAVYRQRYAVYVEEMNLYRDWAAQSLNSCHAQQFMKAIGF